jgi:hypothetical protein
MEAGYRQNALNCWIAALLYLVTLCVSVQQFWMNNRSSNRQVNNIVSWLWYTLAYTEGTGIGGALLLIIYDEMFPF